MWRNTYEDCPVDELLSREQIETGASIIGCQMKELNGWGEKQDLPIKPKSGGILKALIDLFFTRKSE